MFPTKLRNITRESQDKGECVMNSILTFEERILLQSLGCKSRLEALNVLSNMVGSVSVSSPIFNIIVGLISKLKDASFDFAYEMRANNGIHDLAEML